MDNFRFTIRPPDLPEAACQGLPVETFYPLHQGGSADGKKICDTCPVVVACLRHGLANERWGTWGGKSEWERGGLRRTEQRRARRARAAEVRGA